MTESAWADREAARLLDEEFGVFVQEELDRLRAENASLHSDLDRLLSFANLGEAWDEVERLRAVVERLEVEKAALAEELLRRGGGDPS